MTYFAHGKAPTRQLHGVSIAVSGSGHTRKLINVVEAVIRYAQIFAQGAEVRLASDSQ